MNIFPGNVDFRKQNIERCPHRDINLMGNVAWAFQFRGCFILVSIDNGKWHMSISNSKHYPDWDTIRDARYALLPNEITMAMLLPKKQEYVNVHKNCFHLHEIEDDGF